MLAIAAQAIIIFAMHVSHTHRDDPLFTVLVSLTFENITPTTFQVHMVLYTSGAFCNTESFLASNCSRENIIVSLTN